eukprot:6048005-Amphidinium_carterae.1
MERFAFLPRSRVISTLGGDLGTLARHLFLNLASQFTRWRHNEHARAPIVLCVHFASHDSSPARQDTANRE